MKEVTSMTIRRIIASLFCALLLYCCLWVPWKVNLVRPGYASFGPERVGYGWLWAGPRRDSPWNMHARPDMEIIALRIFASGSFLICLYAVAGSK
jgi:hypothetical protein